MKALLPFLLATVMFLQAGEIHDAAAKGDTARLIAILKKDSLLLHARDYQGRATPLAVAIAKGRLGCVRALLDAGANVNEPGDENRVMPLMLAVGSMDEEVQVLFQFAEARRKVDSLPEGVARRKSHDKLAVIEKQVPPESLAKIPQLPLPTPQDRMEILKIMLAQKPELKIQDKAGMTAMHYAARYATAGVLTLLIEHGGDVNIRSRDWRTPLHEAAENDNFQSAEVLLKNGARFDAAMNDGTMALHLAAANGSMPLVDLLLAQTKRSDIQNSKGATALHLASQAGKTEVVVRLLNAGTDVSIPDLEGMTPLHYASSYGRIEIVRVLLKRGAKLEQRDDAGFTPLIYAAERGQMQVFEVLLAEGADPKLRTKSEQTALHFASGLDSSPEWIERLITLGVAVEAMDNQRMTPLHMAASWGRLANVETLLKHGADVNALTSNGIPPVQFAADQGANLPPDTSGVEPEGKGSPEDYQTICELLATKGARLDVVTKERWTLLHSAAATGNIKLVQRTLAAGLSVTATLPNGKTPLHLAAATGHIAVAELLLKNGASVVAIDEAGDSPLHYAASKNPNPEMIPLLVKHGAKINLANQKFKATPLHLAAAWGNVGAVKALLVLGANVTIGDYAGDTPLHNSVQITDINKIAERSWAKEIMASEKPVDWAKLAQSPILNQIKNDLSINRVASLKTDLPLRKLEIARLLLENGASPSAKNNEGISALSGARSVSTKEILELLQNPPPIIKKPRKP